jgi:hypothetical protein
MLQANAILSLGRIGLSYQQSDCASAKRRHLRRGRRNGTCHSPVLNAFRSQAMIDKMLKARASLHVASAVAIATIISAAVSYSARTAAVTTPSGVNMECGGNASATISPGVNNTAQTPTFSTSESVNCDNIQGSIFDAVISGTDTASGSVTCGSNTSSSGTLQIVWSDGDPASTFTYTASIRVDAKGNVTIARDGKITAGTYSGEYADEYIDMRPTSSGGSCSSNVTATNGTVSWHIGDVPEEPYVLISEG